MNMNQPRHLLALVFLMGAGSLAACTAGDTQESPDDVDDEGSVAEDSAALVAGKRGMTWTRKSRSADIDTVGSDPSTNTYQGDTSCSAQMPILCIRQPHLPKPASITSDYYYGWSGGYVGVTKNHAGTDLTSMAAGDTICVNELGTGWAMAEFHDGGFGNVGIKAGDNYGGADAGWNFRAYGASPNGRFWVAINDQPANCWNSCSASTYYRDADGDGYGNAQISVTECSAPSGYVANANDCNDANAWISPAAVEVCGDAIDNNCSGVVDEGCGCTISGQTYQPGQLNPSNPCQKCTPSQSKTAWSNNDGYTTLPDGYCKYGVCIGGCAAGNSCAPHGSGCGGSTCSGGELVCGAIEFE